MSDATGKAVGKRVLDEHGNWRAVSTLSSEVQAEIKKNNKIADAERRDAALRHNESFQKHIAEKEQADLKAENAELKDLVKSQGEALAKINAKLELGATVTKSEPKVDAPKPKKLSAKQKLVAECEEKGIEFEESETASELKAKIEEFDGHEESEDQF